MTQSLIIVPLYYEGFHQLQYNFRTLLCAKIQPILIANPGVTQPFKKSTKSEKKTQLAQNAHVSAFVSRLPRN